MEFIFVGTEVIELNTISDLVYAEDRVLEAGMSHANIWTGDPDVPIETNKAVFAPVLRFSNAGPPPR